MGPCNWVSVPLVHKEYLVHMALALIKINAWLQRNEMKKGGTNLWSSLKSVARKIKPDETHDSWLCIRRENYAHSTRVISNRRTYHCTVITLTSQMQISYISTIANEATLIPKRCSHRYSPKNISSTASKEKWRNNSAYISQMVRSRKTRNKTTLFINLWYVHKIVTKKQTRALHRFVQKKRKSTGTAPLTWILLSFNPWTLDSFPSHASPPWFLSFQPFNLSQTSPIPESLLSLCSQILDWQNPSLYLTISF